MHGSMHEQFMQTPEHRMTITSIGDSGTGATADNPELITGVIQWCKDAITEYRVFDLTANWDTLFDTANEASGELYSGDGSRKTIVQAHIHVDLPLIDAPAIGIYGWYQIFENQALVVVPTSDADLTYVFNIWTTTDVHGKPYFMITTGTTIEIRDGVWGVHISLSPRNSTNTAKFEAMTPE